MQNTAPMPSFAILRSFEAAARHQSFTLAAEELGVTQGAISRQVRDLEGAIGARLFRRVGRAVRLTNAGRALSDDLSGDLARLGQTISRAVASGEGASILSLAVLPTFAARWLVPRLPDFRREHPGIELIMTSRSDPFDLIAERVDLAIHFGAADWPGTRLAPLCPEDLVAVASPAFIELHGVGYPSAIFAAPLLHLMSRPRAWELYRASLGLGAGALPGQQFDQFSMIISAALCGLGSALLPAYLIEQEIADGVLVVLGDAPSDDGVGYFIATPVGEDNREAARFSAWIRGQVSQRRPTRGFATPPQMTG